MLLPESMMRYMRKVAATGFVDTCQRLVFTATDGEYGTGTGKPTYSAGITMACLFKQRPAPDAQEQSEVLMIDADLYLARDATLLPNDRVKVTHLHGDAVASPQTFDIVGGPVLGKTLLHAELRLVTEE